MNKKVGIVIPNWNGYKVLKKCLSSLKKLNYKNYKVIVVDNGSEDESLEFIRKNYPKVKIIGINKNYGFCYAVNKGIKFALKSYKADYILSFNNDAEIMDEDTLLDMISLAESDKKIGIMGFNIKSHEGNIQFAYYGEKIDNNHPEKYNIIKEVSAISGVAMLFKKETVEKIGIFDERFFYGRDDLDYCFRARKAGLKVIYNGKIKIKHYGGYSFELSHDNEYLQKAIAKGLIIFSFKNLGILGKISSILRVMVESVITKKDKTRSFGLKNLKIRDRAIRRFFSSFNTIYEALRSLKKKN